jgi:hypothetical protein
VREPQSAGRPTSHGRFGPELPSRKRHRVLDHPPIRIATPRRDPGPKVADGDRGVRVAHATGEINFARLNPWQCLSSLQGIGGRPYIFAPSKREIRRDAWSHRHELRLNRSRHGQPLREMHGLLQSIAKWITSRECRRLTAMSMSRHHVKLQAAEKTSPPSLGKRDLNLNQTSAE